MGGEGNKSVVRHRMAGQKGEAGDGAKVLAQVRAKERYERAQPTPNCALAWALGWYRRHQASIFSTAGVSPHLHRSWKSHAWHQRCAGQKPLTNGHPDPENCTSCG